MGHSRADKFRRQKFALPEKNVDVQLTLEEQGRRSAGVNQLGGAGAVVGGAGRRGRSAEKPFKIQAMIERTGVCRNVPCQREVCRRVNCDDPADSWIME